MIITYDHQNIFIVQATGLVKEKEFNLTKAFSSLTMAKSYKTFYNCNLRMFVKGKSVCPWMTFPSNPRFVGKARSLLK